VTVSVHRSILAAGLLLLGTLVAAPSAGAAGNDDAFSPQLPSGHCLQATRSDPAPELDSANGRFQLWLWYQGQLQLENHIDSPVGGYGYPIWDPVALKSGVRTAALCMQRNGDLVVHQGTRFVWHTGTATTAAGGYARLLDTGRLVVRTKAGKTVWSSSTTAVLMAAGDKLPSGQVLVNRTYPGSTTILEMRTNGDLVLRRNGTTTWHSNTHVRGSYMYITTTGRMAIATPAHKAIWNTRAVGRYPLLRVTQLGRLTLQERPNGACYVFPASSNPDCGAG
jgi:hypothetical protein